MPIVQRGILRENPEMERVLTMCCLLLIAADARAYNLGDNPAFCAGFLASQSDRYAAMMRTHENAIMDAFNRDGPKDSTDGRDFTEWLHIGAQAAQDTNDAGYKQTITRCRMLIEQIAHK